MSAFGPFQASPSSLDLVSGSHNELWHLTPKGQVRKCKAKRNKCPYSDEPHTAAYNEREAYKKLEQKIREETPVHINKPEVGYPLKENSVLSARDMADYSKKLADENGQNADTVEFQGRIEINDDHPPIYIERFYKEGIKLLPKWRLSRTTSDGTRVSRVYDILNEDQIHNNIASFFTGEDQGGGAAEPIEFKGYSKEEYIEAVRELRERIKELVRAVENEIELSPQRYELAHPIGDYTVLEKDQEGRITGSIEYNTTGFRPEHLRNVDVGKKEKYEKGSFLELMTKHGNKDSWSLTANQKVKEWEEYNTFVHKSYTGVSPGFKVKDQAAGEGVAAWDMTYQEDGSWVIKLRGTRGDTQQLTTSSPTEAETAAQNFFSRRIKRRNYLKEGKLANEMGRTVTPNQQERDDESHRQHRVSFMGRMIKETRDFQARIAVGAEELAKIRGEFETLLDRTREGGKQKKRFGIF